MPAFDMVTLIDCMNTMGPVWDGINGDQHIVIGHLRTFAPQLSRIKGLKNKASKRYQELNDFLSDNGFAPSFDPFPEESGLGACSILDKYVKWLFEGEDALISAADGNTYGGFLLPKEGVSIYETVYGYLLSLATKSDDTLWLFRPSVPAMLDGLELVQYAIDTMAGSMVPSFDFAGARLPNVHIDCKPDISFMLGAGVSCIDNRYRTVDQAFQMFRFGMNKKGARAKVATGMVALEAFFPELPPFIMDRPFYGWFTQKGMTNLPMATFRADYGDWKDPGDLDNL